MDFEIVDDLSEIEPEQYSREKKVKHESQYMGYDEPVNLLDCPHCGSCVDPDTCVWGIVCPKCNAGQSQLCRTTAGTLTGLHEERWRLAKGREYAWRE